MKLLRRRTVLAIYLLVGLACLSSCSSGLFKQLSEMSRLRQELMNKFQEKDINVHLQNDVYLTISLVNSPLNRQDNAAREARAAEVAKFVAKNFPRIQQIKSIWVMFVKSETRLVLFHYSQSVGGFVFNNRGESVRRNEPLSTTTAENEDPLSPTVKFNPGRNETDISLTRVQLAGDTNHGIALVPYYTAKGDARGPARLAAPPPSVTFDFASYADRQIFSADGNLEIVCDGVKGFSGKARLLQPQESGSEASPAQFLMAEIPFDQFVRIGEAHKVQVKLNDQKYDLSPEAIAGLKRMAGFVNPATAKK